MTNKPGRQLYVILREDRFDTRPYREVVVTSVWADLETTVREVNRLNALRGSQSTHYWWLATRTRDDRIRIETD